MARGGARPGAGRPARKSPNTSPPYGACARPRARGGRKSKTVAGRQGRAVGDRPADPVCEKRHEGARLLKAEHPDKAELIDAYGARFHEMMCGPIAGSVEILAELRARGTPLYLLSNFSAETFPPAFARFDFLRWFHGMVISGEVGVR
jgi:FMN phosphatase YigB (HAD superfamily)